jgi:hypothetical protein
VFKFDMTAALYASAEHSDNRTPLQSAPRPHPDGGVRRRLANVAPVRARSGSDSVTLGAYWQDGFGTGAISGVQYEHVWELDRRLYLRYGIGTLSRPYDGDRTRRDYALITLDWRF